MSDPVLTFSLIFAFVTATYFIGYRMGRYVTDNHIKTIATQMWVVTERSLKDIGIYDEMMDDFKIRYHHYLRQEYIAELKRPEATTH